MRSRVRHPCVTGKEPKGPGTPRGRFNRIMRELEARWPDPEPFSAQAGEGRYFEMIDAERASMRAALQAAITALDDWTRTIAPKHCNPQRVAETEERIGRVGTIAYITDVVTQCRKALNQDLENDQNRNEDR